MANTEQRLYATARLELAEKINEKGILIAINTSNGRAVRASDAANRRVVGINEEVGEIGEFIVVKAGIFRFDNDSTNPVTKAHIGTNCYVASEKRVSSSGGTNNVVAGLVVDVDSNGVWVKVGI